MASPAASSSEEEDMPATAESSGKDSGSDAGNNDDDSDVAEVDEEEEEDVDGEEVVEDDDDDDDDGGGGDEIEKADDSSDSPISADQGKNDSTEEVKLDGNDDDLRSGSTTPRNSKQNLSTDIHDIKDNGFSESAVDKKVGILEEKKGGTDVQKDFSEANKAIEADLNDNDSNGSSTRTLSANGKEIAAETLMESGFGVKEANDVVYSKEDAEQMDIPEGHDLNLKASSLPIALTRPRSLSPGVEVEEQNKRPAIVCDFFARGWCIKGSACRFLHKKDGVGNTSEGAKVDPQTSNWKSELQVDAALGQSFGKSRLSTFADPSASSVGSNPLKSTFPSETVLHWKHGEGQGHQFHDEHRLSSLPRGDLSSGLTYNESGSTSVVRRDLQRFPLVRDDSKFVPSFQDEGRGNLRQNYLLDDHNRHTSILIQGDVPKFGTSGRSWAPNHCETQQTSSVLEEFNQKSLSGLRDGKTSVTEELARGSPLARSSLVPEYRYFSSGSIYRSSSYPFAYDRNMEEAAGLKQQSISPSSHTFSWSGASSSHVSSTFGIDPLAGQKHLDSDKGYHPSRSASLPRSSSSPFNSKLEAENLLHSVPRDPPISGYKSQFSSNDWEPSVPFRPSFHFSQTSISSPGSQYDPLLDSIEPPSGANRSFQAAYFGRGSATQSSENQLTNGDPSLIRTNIPEYNTHGVLEKDSYNYGTGLHIAAKENVGAVADEHNRSTMPKEEKPFGSGHSVDVANLDKMSHDGGFTHQSDGSKLKKELRTDGGQKIEVDLHRNSKHQVDEARPHKESKALKLFRTDLVDFVKELVKPSWRGGHLSKDAHKTIVKKAVDKVLSTLQPHQIPNTTESINQYLSSSRPKITKLVEAYVEKYGKT
ncbi:PREDICTED: protein FRIGIDA-ESSENTIAL 1 isoform X2 [Nelumbo nucifera]|uniref:C3H1-type domain-containing protein n=2 Tax=Nelumbo nucifera TaxID=4432 RepID=A0A822XU96_NELNU|nr:PREDICTED: protein FRIGIDA-ESSENTIAL 1 isoform X2 [Nelumbo nucifera]DAD21008.1 TPA_asm: hypothetical protein HUJ06_022471 [Nelumbo nucifera]